MLAEDTVARQRAWQPRHGSLRLFRTRSVGRAATTTAQRPVVFLWMPCATEQSKDAPLESWVAKALMRATTAASPTTRWRRSA